VISQEVSQFSSVGGVFVDSELEVLGELFVELLVIFCVFLDFAEHFHALFDDVLLDDLEDFVLLQEFSGDIQWEIFRIDDSFYETEIFRDEVFTVVHDKDSSDVQFDVVLLLLGLEEIEWGSFRYIEQGFELELSFNGEQFYGQMIFPIVGESFVERAELFLGDVFLFSHPDWFGLVYCLEFGSNFFDFLGLFFFFFFGFFFDLDVLVLFVFRFFRLVIVILDFLFSGLLYHQFNSEGDELRVFLNQFLDSLFFQEL